MMIVVMLYTVYVFVYYNDRFIDTYTFNIGMPVPMRGQDPNNLKTIDVHFYITHINGYTFRLQPNQKFTGLPVGASETLRITGGGWAVSRSEVCCMLSTGCPRKKLPLAQLTQLVWMSSSQHFNPHTFLSHVRT